MLLQAALVLVLTELAAVEEQTALKIDEEEDEGEEQRGNEVAECRGRNLFAKGRRR